MQNIDWECEVKTLFRDQNLGCKYAVSGSITWFFENEEQGIILEDDCLPSQSFFWYCEELLERYKGDLRVGQISGFNRFGKIDLSYDYFFSKYPMIWGWATWRSRWEKYSPDPLLINEVKENKFFETIFNKDEAKQRLLNVELAKYGQINTWDYQWAFAMYVNDFKSVIPSKNMIINLGFGEDATHTALDNPFETLTLLSLNSVKYPPPYLLRLIKYENSIKGKHTLISRLKRFFK